MAGLACGCSTGTTVTDVWATHQAVPMRSVLVMGARTDEASRRALEDGWATRLAEHGVRATPSYTLFPSGFPSTDEAKAAVRSIGFDGLLVSTAKGVSQRTTIVPGAGYDFWGSYYWGPAWGAWYPGYVYTDVFVKFETTLWDAHTGNLVWAANTQTENPSSGSGFVKSLTDKVVPEMVKTGIIPPKGSPERISQALWGSHL
jgi:hypothetical protein